MRDVSTEWRYFSLAVLAITFAVCVVCLTHTVVLCLVLTKRLFSTFSCSSKYVPGNLMLALPLMFQPDPTPNITTGIEDEIY